MSLSGRRTGVGKDCAGSAEQCREHRWDGDHHENVEAERSPRLHPEASSAQTPLTPRLRTWLAVIACIALGALIGWQLRWVGAIAGVVVCALAWGVRVVRG